MFKLYVVSHTHWDREWYQTFQVFRKRLVFMMDELIENLEKDERYKYFHTDGQTILLEDYLEIRPENEKRLKELVKQGRIVIGPWYVMPDEFLVSGESLVRNLQKGFDIARSYGVEPMKSGYVTDIFGHTSQLPQIMKGFGIESAVLFRGIADYPKDTFIWEGADGSNIICLKLDRERSYGSFYFAVRWPFEYEGRIYNEKEIVHRLGELIEYLKANAATSNLLMMDGADHAHIEPSLPWMLDIINDKLEGIEAIHCNLEEYIQAQKDSQKEFDKVKGELYTVGRIGSNNALLKNVLSAMVHLKIMNNECETLLTKWAEPFSVISGFVKPGLYDGFLERAWKYLIQNHPHDSICGCSVSRVHQDNVYRFNQVRDIALEVVKNELEDIACAVNTELSGGRACVVVFNGSQKDFKGVAAIEIEFPEGSQGHFRIFDSNGNELPYQVMDVKKKMHVLKGNYRSMSNAKLKDIYKVALEVDVPAVGYSVYSYEEYKMPHTIPGYYHYSEHPVYVRYLGSMRKNLKTWENEYLTVTIENSGRLTVTNRATGKIYRDVPVFEDAGDYGDGWNYRKPLKDSVYMGITGRADVSIEFDGPLEVMWKLVYYMNLPVDLDEGNLERSGVKREYEIVTYVSMKKGSPRLDFRTEVENHTCGHRLRVMVPSYIDTDVFYSSVPFFLEERKIKAIDWSDYREAETGVYPNQGVVVLRDGNDYMALYNKGLFEVGISEDESRTVALTLFRSFKHNSDQGDMSVMYGKLEFEYALEFGSAGIANEDILVAGETWRTGLRTYCTGSHPGVLPLKRSYVRLEVPGAVLSSFKNGRDGMKILRIYNCTKMETEGYVEIFGEVTTAYMLNLNEEIHEGMDVKNGCIPLKLKPAGIYTLGVMMNCKS